MGIGKFQPPQN